MPSVNAIVFKPTRFDFRQVAAAALSLYLGLALFYPGALSALETQAREAILFDFDTGTVLLEKDADMPMPPASMSKAIWASPCFAT